MNGSVLCMGCQRRISINGSCRRYLVGTARPRPPTLNDQPIVGLMQLEKNPEKNSYAKVKSYAADNVFRRG